MIATSPRFSLGNVGSWNLGQDEKRDFDFNKDRRADVAAFHRDGDNEVFVLDAHGAAIAVFDSTHGGSS